MNDLLCVESDGYDREVFAQIYRGEAGLQKLKDRLGHLLPHPEALLTDIFAVLFKLNVVFKPMQEVSTAVLINRRLVEAILGQRELKELRLRTQLDSSKTAEGLILIAQRILRALTRRDRVSAKQLLSVSEQARLEEDLSDTLKKTEQLEELPEGLVEEEAKQNLKRDLKQEAFKLKQQLKKGREEQKRIVDNLPLEIDNEIGASVRGMSEQMEETDSQMRALGLSVGQPGHTSAQQRLELGERLMQSRKLQLLAKLTGAFKEVAFEARRKTVTRSPQTLHEISSGDNLFYLLSSELPGLKKQPRALHLDFLRKYSEKQLLQYELHGPSSKGPMVICVDGSSSMQGSKELWAKAVALTLMEIARREKRRCLAIVFSSGDQLFEVELLTKGKKHRGRPKVENSSVFRFAEYFPGGGTSFEEPLSRAVEAVGSAQYRNGDVIFITDGEASVSSQLLENLAEKKRKHRFKIRGIVVDVAHHQTQSMQSFCDELRHVSDLSSDGLQDLFSAV